MLVALLDHVCKKTPYTSISLFYSVEIWVVSVWVSYNSELLWARSGCLVEAGGEGSRCLALCWLWMIFYKPSRKDLLSVHQLGMDPPHHECPQEFQWLGHLHHGSLGLITALLHLDEVLVCCRIHTSPYTYWSLLLYGPPGFQAPVFPWFRKTWPGAIFLSQHTAG